MWRRSSSRSCSRASRCLTSWSGRRGGGRARWGRGTALSEGRRSVAREQRCIQPRKTANECACFALCALCAGIARHTETGMTWGPGSCSSWRRCPTAALAGTWLEDGLKGGGGMTTGACEPPQGHAVLLRVWTLFLPACRFSAWTTVCTNIYVSLPPFFHLSCHVPSKRRGVRAHPGAAGGRLGAGCGGGLCAAGVAILPQLARRAARACAHGFGRRAAGAAAAADADEGRAVRSPRAALLQFVIAARPCAVVATGKNIAPLLRGRRTS
jgi:hypothetical protein